MAELKPLPVAKVKSQTTVEQGRRQAKAAMAVQRVKQIIKDEAKVKRRLYVASSAHPPGVQLLRTSENHGVQLVRRHRP